MGNIRSYRLIHGLLICCIAVLEITCERDILNPEQNRLARSILYDIMKEWYLWYDTMPAVNPDDYHSLNAPLDALLCEDKVGVLNSFTFRRPGGQMTNL